MSFRIGLIGLCTSHPENWVPIIRELSEERNLDVEVAAAWDPGETRPAGYAAEFCKKFDIPKAIENFDDMLEEVDGVIIHTANWDRHVEQARPFVDAGKSVLIDKPMAGNLKDLNQLQDWGKQNKRITGGSSLRFAKEVKELLATPPETLGKIIAAYASCGNDEYNYGVHVYSLLMNVFGPDVVSARFLGDNGLKCAQLKWRDGGCGFLAVGQVAWRPFSTIVTTDKATHLLAIATGTNLYRTLLENTLAYMTGAEETPPIPMNELVKAELAALAARMSWLNNGAEVFISDLRLDDPGYDGYQFAQEYRRGRLGPK